MDGMRLQVGGVGRRALARTGRSVATALLSACLVTSGGCASLHHGRRQHVIVTSEPPGARIFADDEPVGVTPDFVTVNRSGTVLRLERNGYRTEEIRVPRAPSAWLAGSMVLAVPFLVAGSSWLVGAALILGVDLGTGAAWEFTDRVEAALEPAGEAPTPAPARMPAGTAGRMDAEPGRSTASGHR